MRRILQNHAYLTSRFCFASSVSNRNEWELKGEEITTKMILECEIVFGALSREQNKHKVEEEEEEEEECSVITEEETDSSRVTARSAPLVPSPPKFSGFFCGTK